MSTRPLSVDQRVVNRICHDLGRDDLLVETASAR
jgi:hypothetical protein